MRREDAVFSVLAHLGRAGAEEERKEMTLATQSFSSVFLFSLLFLSSSLLLFFSPLSYQHLHHGYVSCGRKTLEEDL